VSKAACPAAIFIIQVVRCSGRSSRQTSSTTSFVPKSGAGAEDSFLTRPGQRFEVFWGHAPNVVADRRSLALARFTAAAARRLDIRQRPSESGSQPEVLHQRDRLPASYRSAKGGI